ncbi:MAG: IS982 family transposase, partial [Prevotella sp.]|nr:IS982 family transposase [Prevotella sp.]
MEITKDKITEIFCIIDDFCQEYDKEIARMSICEPDGRKHRNRKCTMSRSEIMTILICFHFNTFRNFKHYYLFYVKVHLHDLFPKQLSYNRFVELESRVAVEMMLFLQLFCFGRCTGISFIDSTCIPVCHNKRITRNKVFRGYAERGKSTMGWYFGFKLHLICNERGELLNFMLTKANVDDRNTDVFNRLSDNVFGKLFADKGYISHGLFERLFNDGIEIVTGLKCNMKNKLMPLYDKILLRK